MLTAQVEKFSECITEAQSMLKEHWEEIALDKEKVPLDPQYDKYLKDESEGKLLVITLRSLGKLVGYFAGFIAPGLHYKTCLSYHMDIFFITPEFRGRHGGFMMVKFLEQELKRRGVQRMHVGVKLHKNAGWLFEKLGFEKVEIHYSKWLGE